MTASIGLGTLLAVFSKENGALLPLLLLTVESCLPPRPAPRLARLWRAVCLWLPSLALLVYLASRIDFSPDLWPNRPFGQPERLWSETRILWEYLRLLFMPQVEGRGLFQDGYAISRGWLIPWTTLPAAIGLLALFIAALCLRRRWPLAALAILFFFAGHLVESSVIGLKLYFGHRNHLSAAFLFLPLGQGLYFLGRKYKPALACVVGGLILAVLAGITWQRAQLWQNPGRLTAYWAALNPDSARAQNAVAILLIQMGQGEQARDHLLAASERLPDSAMLNLNLLLHKINLRQATRQDFERTGQRFIHQPYAVEAVAAMRMIFDRIIQPGNPPFYLDAALDLLDAMDRNTMFSQDPSCRRLSPYLKGRLYLAKSEPAEACRQFEQAIPLYADIESSLGMFAQIMAARAFDCAPAALVLAKKILDQQKDSSLRQPREYYESEMKRLGEIIEQEKRK
jgi:tetratricopeptide (TPR) repeat protein